MKIHLLHLIIFFFVTGTNIFAQKNISLINYHVKDCNKKDLNQVFVNTNTAKIKSIDTSYFENGYVIKAGDTIRCKIYLAKHKISDDNYIYIIASLSDGKNYIFTPKDIGGYGLNNITMIAHRSITSVDTSYFFIKQIEKGDVTLYSRVEIPSDNEFTYYFKKTDSNGFLFFAPNKKSDTYLQERYDKYGEMVSKYSGPNVEQFKKIFAEYLKDCEGVHNKILSGFYGINDLETIITEYNKCKKQ